MEIQPDLTVCVVTNNRSFIQSFLKSLHATTPDISFETIVVAAKNFDNQDIIEEFPQVILYENTAKESLAASLNRAMELGRGRYISLWEQDVSFQNTCLRQLIDFLDHTPETGIAGPRITNIQGTAFLSARSFLGLFALARFVLGFGPPFRKRDALHFPLRKETNKPWETDWLLGSGLVIRREVIEDIGVLDPKMSGQYRAMEYCWRARKKGWHMHYVPTAEIIQLRTAELAPSLSSSCRYLLKKLAL